MCTTSSNLLLVLQDAQNCTFSGQLKNDVKTLFSTLHHHSHVIFATATVAAFVLLHNSRFNFHCYTQREATPTQKLARKWCCNLSRLLAWKITKGIHSCKPALLNRPIMLSSCVHRLLGPNCWSQLLSYFLLYCKEAALIESHQLSWYCGCTMTTPKYKTPRQLLMTGGKTWPTLWPSKRLFLFIL